MITATWHILLELAPWLLLGAMVAAFVHGFLPGGFVKRVLQGPSGVFKAVVLGVPLPLCSCGVIPAGLGLKKDGASDGAAVGFLISTPQTGVDSILVSASFLGWPFALFKVVSAAVTGVVGGLLTHFWGGTPRTVDAGVAAGGGASVQEARWRKMLAHGLQLIRTIWPWLVAGVLISAAIDSYVPKTAFAQFAAYGGVLTLLGALLISLPLYVCATASVPIAASLVAGGLPYGVALVFLMAGPATNVATIGAIHRGFGRRVMMIYLSTIIVGSVAFGVGFDFLLERAPAVAAAAHDMDHDSWWAQLSAAALVGLIVWFAMSDLRSKLGRGDIAASAQSIDLPVKGMTCGGCVGRVERALKELEGVEGVRVTLEPGRAQVAGVSDEQRVREAIQAAGYEVG